MNYRFCSFNDSIFRARDGGGGVIARFYQPFNISGSVFRLEWIGDLKNKFSAGPYN
jgi:hypothetical protein